MKPNNTEPHWMYAQKNPDIFKKYLHLCSTEESHKGQTGWINDSSIIIFGWPLPFFILCDCCDFFFWMRQIEWFGDGQCSCSLSPLSLCFSFPFEPQRLHLSSESLSSDKASTSLLYLHPPSFSLSPSPRFGIPYIHTFSLPWLSMKWAQSLYSDWLESNWIGRMLSISLFLTLTHTHAPSHTHVHANKQTQSRRLLRVRRAHAHACTAVLTHIDAPTHSQSLSICVASTLGWGDVLGQETRSYGQFPTSGQREA